MLRRHPNLFADAKEYEKAEGKDGKGYTWVQGMTLSDIEANADEIVEKAITMRKPGDNRTWQEILAEEGEDDDSCLACSL